MPSPLLKDETGYLGLSRAVSSLGLQTREPLAVDALVLSHSLLSFVAVLSQRTILTHSLGLQCSSLGSTTYDFLANLYDAVAGIAEAHAAGGPPDSPARDEQGCASQQPIDEAVRVFFPAERTVSESRGGKNVWPNEGHHCNT